MMDNYIRKELDELAAYRSSGLTPKQVIELAKYIRNLLKDMEDNEKWDL